MLTTMSQHAEMPLTWSELGLTELLPTGTVTLLLADVEGSTRLWETQSYLDQLSLLVDKSLVVGPRGRNSPCSR